MPPAPLRQMEYHPEHAVPQPDDNMHVDEAKLMDCIKVTSLFSSLFLLRSRPDNKTPWHLSQPLSDGSCVVPQ